MDVFRRLLDLIAPEPTGRERSREDPEGFSATSDPYPEPIEIRDHAKAALKHRVENLSSERALVPSQYTILIHPEAFSKFEPVFGEIGRTVKEGLEEETRRLQKIPYDGSESTGESRKIYPPEKVWVIQLLPVRSLPGGRSVEKHTIEVLTELAISEPGEVVADGEDRDVALTHRPSEEEDYETRHVARADIDIESEEEPLTNRFAFGDSVEAAGQKSVLGSLRYRLPDDNRTYEFGIVRKEIKIGRHTESNEDVDLRLNVERGVSEEHLRLRYNGGEERFEVMDLSRHGTAVNGRRLKKSRPVDGEEFWEVAPEGASISLADTVTLELNHA